VHDLPELYEDSIVLPVVHKRMVKDYWGRISFRSFGVPFYIVLAGNERRDSKKVYNKIRRRYGQFSQAIEFQHEVPETISHDGKTPEVISNQRSFHNSNPTPSFDAIGDKY